ncbi:MFS transporter [Terriglobus aquaticus]|uniref:MFS transporter n=1 Tax=Terriglobus aquaticus TaxID=940139 RepID=A0ABW9KHA4_9BACT|nr:MFS transporter [Terriglobus aquaticus]
MRSNLFRRSRPSAALVSDPNLAVLQTDEGSVVTSLPPSGSGAPGGGLLHLPLRRRLVAFGFLLIAEFFYGWAWNTVDVLRPLFRASLGLTLTQAGSAYSAQGAGALIGAISIGQLADKLGKRNMLVVVMAGYGALLLAGTLVHSYVGLLLQRFVLGLFLGGSFPVVVGIYVELFRPTLRGKLASAINATFSLAIITLGLCFGHLGHHDWRTLLWIGGLPPLLLAVLAYIAIPSAERSYKSGSGKLPLAELFTPALRRQTLLLASMTGLNFFAYQAFSGWLTTYLLNTRHLPKDVVGHLVAAQFAGNILGGFFWGGLSDRFGRRSGAIGFFITAAAIVAYLTVPADQWLLLGIGSLYGFALSASVIWGPWLAELYPPHLKSTASSIFNWGRLVSFFSPILTGQIAEHFGMQAGMLVSSLIFAVAAFIWLSLPETMRRHA